MCEYGSQIAGYWKFSGEEHVEALHAQMLTWKDFHAGHYEELTLIRYEKSRKPSELIIFFRYVIPSGITERREIQSYTNDWKGGVKTALEKRFGANFTGWRTGPVISDM